MVAMARVVSCIRRAGGALGVLGFLTIVPAAHAQAQIPAQAGEPRAPVIVNGYYQEYKGRTCSGTTAGCLVSFTAVPGGQVLIVTNVSCSITGSGTAAMTFFSLASPTTPLIPTLVGTVLGTRFFQSSDEVLAIFRAGEPPLIFVNWSANTSTQLGCKIAGLLKPA